MMKILVCILIYFASNVSASNSTNSTGNHSAPKATSAPFKTTAKPPSTTAIPPLYLGFGKVQSVLTLSFPIDLNAMETQYTTFAVTSGTYKGLGFTVPPGAWPSNVSGPATISVLNATSNKNISAFLPSQPNMFNTPVVASIMSLAYFGPSGIVFNEPVIITLPYNASKAPATAQYGQIFNLDTSSRQWYALPINSTVVNGFISTTTPHFSAYGALAITPPYSGPCSQGCFIGACVGGGILMGLWAAVTALWPTIYARYLVKPGLEKPVATSDVVQTAPQPPLEVLPAAAYSATSPPAASHGQAHAPEALPLPQSAAPAAPAIPHSPSYILPQPVVAAPPLCAAAQLYPPAPLYSAALPTGSTAPLLDPQPAGLSAGPGAAAAAGQSHYA